MVIKRESKLLQLCAPYIATEKSGKSESASVDWKSLIFKCYSGVAEWSSDQMSQAETSEDDLSMIYTLAERVGADVGMQLAFGKKFWLNFQMVKLLIYFSYFKKDFKYLKWAISVALESNFTLHRYMLAFYPNPQTQLRVLITESNVSADIFLTWFQIVKILQFCGSVPWR